MKILDDEININLDNINDVSNQTEIISNYQDLLEDFDANIDLTVILRDKI
jgi:hypothetical protein